MSASGSPRRNAAACDRVAGRTQRRPGAAKVARRRPAVGGRPVKADAAATRAPRSRPTARGPEVRAVGLEGIGEANLGSARPNRASCRRRRRHSRRRPLPAAGPGRRVQSTGRVRDCRGRQSRRSVGTEPDARTHQPMRGRPRGSRRHHVATRGKNAADGSPRSAAAGRSCGAPGRARIQPITSRQPRARS